MNAPPDLLSSKDVARAHEELRGAQPTPATPARKRDRLLQRVRAARKRFPQTTANGLARIR
jgi:hypothetical protein